MNEEAERVLVRFQGREFLMDADDARRGSGLLRARIEGEPGPAWGYVHPDGRVLRRGREVGHAREVEEVERV